MSGMNTEFDNNSNHHGGSHRETGSGSVPLVPTGIDPTRSESVPSVEPKEGRHASPARERLDAIERRGESRVHAPSRVRVLSIEGSDPIGGAGTMADMKTFTALGVFGYAAMTSVLAQNTRGVSSIVTMDPDFLLAQLDAVGGDADIDSIKIGMLGTRDLVSIVRGWLVRLEADYEHAGKKKPVVVLDPVMYAKSGDCLITSEARQALRTLIPLADIITPNLPELAFLSRTETSRPKRCGSDGHGSDGHGSRSTGPATPADMERWARDVCARYRIRVYAKAGAFALEGADDCTDILAEPVPPDRGGDGVRIIRMEGSAVRTSNVHGTGDTLSSSLAALRPQCRSWEETARRAKTWITGAIAAADRLHIGRGHGPVDFTWRHAPTGLSFSADFWNRVEPVRSRISSMEFIRCMVAGTLDPSDFSFYLHQDDLYLHDYTSLLALASARAHRIEERVFFGESASFGVQEGLGFHAGWYRDHGFDDSRAPMSEVTAAYIGHEHRMADTGSYGALIAAVMPCFWLYAAMGKELRAQVERAHVDMGAHPYAQWIDMYSDAGFLDRTVRELDICDRVAAGSSIEEYQLMMKSALLSAEHEYRFFEQGIERPAVGF
jgi:hydroxymethylpyrimidine/phosphomethylpyrimidine kinase/hydroxymethylpyrimidine kinase/phosphomethylpyrimidine kinase/thiamine-phosphate diphosphorylase